MFLIFTVIFTFTFSCSLCPFHDSRHTHPHPLPSPPQFAPPPAGAPYTGYYPTAPNAYAYPPATAAAAAGYHVASGAMGYGNAGMDAGPPRVGLAATSGSGAKDPFARQRVMPGVHVSGDGCVMHVHMS